jgi:hypothetical protein
MAHARKTQGAPDRSDRVVTMRGATNGFQPYAPLRRETYVSNWSATS